VTEIGKSKYVFIKKHQGKTNGTEINEIKKDRNLRPGSGDLREV
jgi:hypothetical protein